MRYRSSVERDFSGGCGESGTTRSLNCEDDMLVVAAVHTGASRTSLIFTLYGSLLLTDFRRLRRFAEIGVMHSIWLIISAASLVPALADSGKILALIRLSSTTVFAGV
jgi:hypothetical protein